jgi:hypothetical protein
MSDQMQRRRASAALEDGAHGGDRRQAQPQSAGGALSICLSHWQMAVRGKIENRAWRMADVRSNVVRLLHPRRQSQTNTGSQAPPES